MPDRDRDYRLINAAIAAGDIGKPAFESSTFFANIGLKPQTVRTFVHGPSLINAAFLGERREGGYILSFRGTLSGPEEEETAVCLDWTQDRDYGFAPWVMAHVAAGHVPRGFWTALDDLLTNGLRDAVAELYRRDRNVSLWITGHSKGGAMAILVASHLSNDYMPPHYVRPEIVTFGAPRVGTPEFVRVYGVCGLEAQTVRYQTRYDIVAKVPEVYLAAETGSKCPGLQTPFLPVPSYSSSVGALTYIVSTTGSHTYTMETGARAESDYLASIDELGHMDATVAKTLIGIAHYPKGGYLLAFGRDPVQAAPPQSATPWAGAKAATSDAPAPPGA